MYLELAGEDQPIPVFPLAPGSGHQPFTVKVASPLTHPESAETSSETSHKPTSQVPSPFEPAESERFSADDASPSLDSPEPLPASLPGSFGTEFFESGADFGRTPSARFPNFETSFEGLPSRRRGARRLVLPTEVTPEVTPEVSGVTTEVIGDSGQLSPEAEPEYVDSQVSKWTCSVITSEFNRNYNVVMSFWRLGVISIAKHFSS